MPVFAKVVRYFEEVARHGSIRRAAEYLHVTASAVDRQILLLEERVGTPLFERLPRGVRLTAAGEIVLQSVRQLARSFDAAVSAVDELRGLRRGHVTVSGLQFLSDSVFPVFIREARKAHPGISISAFVATTEEVLRDVIAGAADFGVCYAPVGRLPVTVLKSVPLRMGAVVPLGHPLASASKVRLVDCMKYPLVMPRQGMELRTRIERVRVNSALELRPSIETNSIRLMKLVLQDGTGVGFLTEADALAEVAAGQLVWLPLADPGVAASSIALIVHGQQSLPFAATAVREQLEAAFASLAAPGRATKRLQRPKRRNALSEK
jgi:DNA-binding transcriptional LysR family regulator